MVCLCKDSQKFNLVNSSTQRRALIFSYTVSALALASSVFSTPIMADSSTQYVGNQIKTKSQTISENELAATELKLLSKTYVNDPLSKRLQRLELLTFGATQYGSDNQRWHNIQRYLQNKNGSARNNSGGGNNVSTSLNELEKYVFKKTNPSLSTAKRLDKLETKLFGQPSSSLATGARIARLQRTLGLPESSGEMAELPDQRLPPGMKNFNNSPYFKRMEPGNPNSFGFSFGFNGDDMNDPDLNQFETQMNRMMREMERQMQDQMQQAPGYPEQPLNPRRAPEFNAPRMSPQPQREKIPSYNDPNFI
jgi:hypothetical protein